MRVSIQQQDFDLGAELAALHGNAGQAGALVSFVGLVRDFSDSGAIKNIYLEHYQGMTEKALNTIIDEATSRWQLINARVIHRVGLLLPSEQIVLVATAASHRPVAFAACEYIIDHLKTAAPFWKREQTSNATHWLETRDSDEQRTARWENKTA